MENREQQKQPNKHGSKQLQYLLAAAAFSLMLNLGTPTTTTAQNKETHNKEMGTQTIEKKEIVNERSEINMLKEKFKRGKYGSDHFISLLGGRFIGENGKTIVNGRSLTSAYDYLILDNNFLALLVNLGFTEDNIKFVSTKKLRYRTPYALGYSTYQENKKKEILTDSAYSQIHKKNIAIKKSVSTNYSMYTIDSSKTAKVSVGGLSYNKKIIYIDENGQEKKKRIKKFIELPQLENTGAGTDVNNFDLAYETMAYIYDQNKNDYDMSTRQFSEKVPLDFKNYILKNIEIRKEILAKQSLAPQMVDIILKPDETVKDTTYSGPEYGLDMANLPNSKTFNFGNYQFFRYFTDIYRRDIRYTGQGMNPVWHNAFQNDSDNEKHKNGLIDFLVLPYGEKKYTMPTLIPKQNTGYTKLDGLISFNQRGESHESIKTIILNGRLVGTDKYEVTAEKGLFTLFREGTVDRMYKIYSIKDQKVFWIYLYCGIQSGIRGGSIGKFLPDKAIELKNKLVSHDVWKMAKNTSFEDYIANKEIYISGLTSYIEGVDGFAGKTIPNIIIPVNIQNPNNPKKHKVEYKKIRFLDDKTAMIDLYEKKPKKNEGEMFSDTLMVGYNIIKNRVNKGLKRENTKDIEIDFLGTIILLDSLPGLLSGNNLSQEKIQENNKKFLKEKTEDIEKAKNAPPTSIKYDEKKTIDHVYKNHIYNLSDKNDANAIIKETNKDIADLTFTITTIKESIHVQKNSKILKIQNNLNLETDTESRSYKNLKKNYNEEMTRLADFEKQLIVTKNERTRILKLQQKYYMNYIDALEFVLKKYNHNVIIMKQTINDAKREMKELTPNSDIYKGKEKKIQLTQEEINYIELQTKELQLQIDEIKNEKQKKQHFMLYEND